MIEAAIILNNANKYREIPSYDFQHLLEKEKVTTGINSVIS
jgi:predicted HTH domain antitoxin